MDQKTRNKLNAILENMAREAKLQNNILAAKNKHHIIEMVLSLSHAKNYTDAVKEWHIRLVWKTKGICCELCEEYQKGSMYRVDNELTRNIMAVCPKCMNRYLWEDSPNRRKNAKPKNKGRNCEKD